MRKALRRIETDASLVDAVLMLLDARMPATSRNPALEKTLQGRHKQIFYVLNKADLAAEAVTRGWVAWLDKRGTPAVALSQTRGDGKAKLAALLGRERQRIVDTAQRKGLLTGTLRVMVVGIPNVGKSTLINRLAGAARAKAGKRPGLTRGPQWINLPGNVELLDTPGVMMPGKLEPHNLLALAVTGTIKEDVLPLEDLGLQMVDLIVQHGWQEQALGQTLPKDTAPSEWLEALCTRRGFLLRGGEPDVRRAILFLLKSLRDGRFGPISLEDPP